MASTAFIGDELSAAGFRLAGVSTYSPAREHVAETFARARQDRELLLMTEAYARELPNSVLQAALRESKPLLLVVPDLRLRVLPPDLGRSVDLALGIES